MSKKIQVVGLDLPQSDWNQTDATKNDYIKNKPNLGALAAKDKVSKDELDQEVKERLDTIPSVEGLATEEYVDESIDNLAPVAKSNSFNDLKNKPAVVFNVTDDGVLCMDMGYEQDGDVVVVYEGSVMIE